METVRPLARRQTRATRVISPKTAVTKAAPLKTSRAGDQASLNPVPPAAEARPQPQSLDPNETRKIRRGQRPIEAHLDLHGLTAAVAHSRLVAFIDEARGQRLTWVIVITGKGVGGRGVLRQSVPEWLSTPPLKSKVLGFEQAQPAHGGSGALYIRLRRKS